MIDTAAEAREFFKAGKAKFGDEQSIWARDVLRAYDDVKSVMDDGMDKITCWTCHGSGLAPVDDHMTEYYFGDLSADDECPGCMGEGDRFLDVEEYTEYPEIVAIRDQMLEDGVLEVD